MINDRPTVLHVTTTDMSLDILLADQLEALQDKGYRVVTASAPGSHVLSLVERNLAHFPLARSTRSWDPRSDVLSAFDLGRVIRHVRPDIVHTHNPKPGIYGRIVARLAGVPVVVNTVHGLYAQRGDPFPKQLAIGTLERFAAIASNAELFQNTEDLAFYRKMRVPEDRLHHLGNGIDLKRFHPARDEGERAAIRRRLGNVSPGDVVVGCVGRITRQKGIEDLLDAYDLVRKQEPQLRLVFVGPIEEDTDSSADALAERARRMGAGVLGARSDCDELYRGLDILVSASHREGFPRSVMEASATGIPVVATNIRGTREAVVEGLSGVLVPPRDAGLLAEALGRLAKEPLERERLGAGGLKVAQDRFDFNTQVQIIDELYRGLLRKAEAGGRAVRSFSDGPPSIGSSSGYELGLSTSGRHMDQR